MLANKYLLTDYVCMILVNLTYTNVVGFMIARQKKTSDIVSANAHHPGNPTNQFVMNLH